MKLSIIIPAKNEALRIKPTLQQYAEYFSKDTEIIIVLNGCTDHTLKIVEELQKKYKQVTLLYYEQPIGKGGAVLEGFKQAKGEYLSFVDADSSTPPDQLEKLYFELKDSNYAGTIGSRWIKGSLVKKYQPLSRIIASRVYNILVRLLLHMPYKDTQCGAKIFKAAPIHEVIDKVVPTNWEFDVSLLYALYQRGYKVKEVPIVWEDKLGSNLKISKTAPKMFKSLLEIRRGK